MFASKGIRILRTPVRAPRANGRLKRILGPKCGFKTPVTAYRTLQGIEAMHALREGQGRIFAYGHPNPDVVIVEKAFAHA